MSAYQGRALWTAPRPRPRGVKPGWIVLLVLAVSGVAFVARDRLAATKPYRVIFTVPKAAVRGAVYLSEAEVRSAAGLAKPADFLRVDLVKAKTKLEKSPRVASARVERTWPRGIAITIVERMPAVLVRAGRMLEADREGRILPAVASGVLADAPVVSGVTVRDVRAGAKIKDARFARAMRHLDALAKPEVGLMQPVSQIDVADARTTVVTLAPDGIDILLPAEPAGIRPLSALRVVLADLASRGLSASRVDLRGEQVIAVRPVPIVRGGASAADSSLLVHPQTRRG
jgi:cell division protein FtsQ